MGFDFRELMCPVLLAFERSHAQVNFESDVLPILQNHCYQCHGPKQRESGLSTDVRESAMKGVILVRQPSSLAMPQTVRFTVTQASRT